MADEQHFPRAAGVIGVFTLASRVLGFVRDVCIAWLVGAGFISDAFFVAFRIPNFFRRLFVEGALSAPFVSVFTETAAANGREDADRFAASALRRLSLVLVLGVPAAMAAAPVIVRIMAPGFLASSEKLALTVTLTRFMMPYVFFVVMAAAAMGFLNAVGHFSAPALSPVLLNAAMIGAVVCISPHMAEPVMGLAVGVIAGGGLQLALQAAFLIKKGIRPVRPGLPCHPGVKKAGIRMPSMVFGAAVFHLNMFIGTFLASFLHEGSVSHLYYADRLVQFPLGIFAVAIATAILPVMARQAVAGKRTEVCETFSKGLRMAFFVALPSMAGLVVLRRPVVELLFQRGQFDAGAVLFTSQALMYYCLGLWAFSGVRITVSAFHAVGDAGTPARAALTAVLINIFLGVALMGPMGTNGVALAASVSAAAQFFLLFRHVRGSIGPLHLGPLLRSAGKSLVCTLIMAAVIAAISMQMTVHPGTATPELAWGVAICIFSGVAVYTACSCVMRRAELKTFMKGRG